MATSKEARSECLGFFCPLTSDEHNLSKSEMCTDVTMLYNAIFVPSDQTVHFKSGLACCKLYCGHHDLFASSSLQCQGLSPNTATLFTFLVVSLVICGALSILSLIFDKGEKSGYVRGPLFLTYISVTTFAYSSWAGGTAFDTVFYHIIVALDVSAFSYFFAGYQYGLGLGYELISLSALVVTMNPIWTLLTADVHELIGLKDCAFYTSVLVSAVLVLASLVLSVLWVIHSTWQRTVGYRAAWNAAFNKQRVEGQGDFMSHLWMLAAAEGGHPTWRTPAGRSLGFCLASMSWVVSVLSHRSLPQSCTADTFLFYVMVWTPPVILTIAIVTIQVKMFRKVPFDVKGTDNSLWQWLKVEIRSVRGSFEDTEEALLSYRLGRDTLEVERDLVRRFRFQLSLPRKCVISAKFASYFWVMVIWTGIWMECAIYALVYPGAIALQIGHWLVRSVLKRTSSFSRCQHRRRSPSSPRFSLEVKIEAFKALTAYCLSEEESSHYFNTAAEAVSEELIDDEVCRILQKHRRGIRFCLLLDNIDPSGLAYLLQQLVAVLNDAPVEDGQAETSTTEVKSDAPVATAAAHSVHNGTHDFPRHSRTNSAPTDLAQASRESASGLVQEDIRTPEECVGSLGSKDTVLDSADESSNRFDLQRCEQDRSQNVLRTEVGGG